MTSKPPCGRIVSYFFQASNKQIQSYVVNVIALLLAVCIYSIFHVVPTEGVPRHLPETWEIHTFLKSTSVQGGEETWSTQDGPGGTMGEMDEKM